eukprot:Blabericola_migrator_1__6777@NODE_342_length_9595_cov_35_497376_g275_i0_p1_GENE_NODE_342_length_9595_cov_35_497376_g275_i0NODE_342_length_9595_cov_35_497376_g275_i0_p1_ORF_typecomplete_len1085_score136_17_NODE_342_length_9595_cov_35_497376_g275_i025935847
MIDKRGNVLEAPKALREATIPPFLPQDVRIVPFEYVAANEISRAMRERHKGTQKHGIMEISGLEGWKLGMPCPLRYKVQVLDCEHLNWGGSSVVRATLALLARSGTWVYKLAMLLKSISLPPTPILSKVTEMDLLPEAVSPTFVSEKLSPPTPLILPRHPASVPNPPQAITVETAPADQKKRRPSFLMPGHFSLPPSLPPGSLSSGPLPSYDVKPRNSLSTPLPPSDVTPSPSWQRIDVNPKETSRTVPPLQHPQHIFNAERMRGAWSSAVSPYQLLRPRFPAPRPAVAHPTIPENLVMSSLSPERPRSPMEAPTTAETDQLRMLSEWTSRSAAELVAQQFQQHHQPVVLPSSLFGGPPFLRFRPQAYGGGMGGAPTTVFPSIRSSTFFDGQLQDAVPLRSAVYSCPPASGNSPVVTNTKTEIFTDAAPVPRVSPEWPISATRRDTGNGSQAHLGGEALSHLKSQPTVPVYSKTPQYARRFSADVVSPEKHRLTHIASAKRRASADVMHTLRSPADDSLSLKKSPNVASSSAAALHPLRANNLASGVARADTSSSLLRDQDRKVKRRERTRPITAPRIDSTPLQPPRSVKLGELSSADLESHIVSQQGRPLSPCDLQVPSTALPEDETPPRNDDADTGQPLSVRALSEKPSHTPSNPSLKIRARPPNSSHDPAHSQQTAQRSQYQAQKCYENNNNVVVPMREGSSLPTDTQIEKDDLVRGLATPGASRNMTLLITSQNLQEAQTKAQPEALHSEAIAKTVTPTSGTVSSRLQNSVERQHQTLLNKQQTGSVPPQQSLREMLGAEAACTQSQEDTLSNHQMSPQRSNDFASGKDAMPTRFRVWDGSPEVTEFLQRRGVDVTQQHSEEHSEEKTQQHMLEPPTTQNNRHRQGSHQMDVQQAPSGPEWTPHSSPSQPLEPSRQTSSQSLEIPAHPQDESSGRSAASEPQTKYPSTFDLEAVRCQLNVPLPSQSALDMPLSPPSSTGSRPRKSHWSVAVISDRRRRPGPVSPFDSYTSKHSTTLKVPEKNTNPFRNETISDAGVTYLNVAVTKMPSTHSEVPAWNSSVGYSDRSPTSDLSSSSSMTID